MSCDASMTFRRHNCYMAETRATARLCKQISTCGSVAPVSTRRHRRLKESSTHRTLQQYQTLVFKQPRRHASCRSIDTNRAINCNRDKSVAMYLRSQRPVFPFVCAFCTEKKDSERPDRRAADCGFIIWAMCPRMHAHSQAQLKKQ